MNRCCGVNWNNILFFLKIYLQLSNNWVYFSEGYNVAMSVDKMWITFLREIVSQIIAFRIFTFIGVFVILSLMKCFKWLIGKWLDREWDMWIICWKVTLASFGTAILTKIYLKTNKRVVDNFNGSLFGCRTERKYSGICLEWMPEAHKGQRHSNDL